MATMQNWQEFEPHHYFHITTRIYNPNKNIQDRDPELRFINYWVPELRGYSLSEILEGRYTRESPYPPPILDWAQTRKENGKVVSDLRQQVKERLQREQGEEYRNALAAKETVDKYWKAKG